MIDPQAEAVRAAFNAGPPLDQVGLEPARKWLAGERARRQCHTAVNKVADLTAGDIAVRLYHPQPDSQLPVIVFAHGGGWVLGSVDTADEACRRLANAAACAVLSVEYRLAPEVRHPGPVQDMLAVLNWLPGAAAELSVDARRVAIAGESSGAHVACSAVLAACELGLAGTGKVPTLAAQLLVCPAVDPQMGSASWATLGEHYVPRRSQMRWMWGLYLGEQGEFAAGAPDPAVADVTGAPPTVLVVAEYDPLRDEGLELARRMEAAGTAVQVIDCAGQIHPVFAHAAAVDNCDLYLRQAAGAVGALLRQGE